MPSTRYGNRAMGEQLPQSRLTEKAVREIRAAIRDREALRRKIDEEYSNEALAAQYGVHRRTIEQVANWSTWAHVRID